MKKSLLALAVLGAFAGAASAQSSVTIYGIVDTSIAHIDNGNDSVNSLRSGNNNSSRIGFKGAEDLGNGLKATFVLENGINTDDGTSADSTASFSRLSYVGLEGSFGAVRLGKQNTQIKTAMSQIDPFETGGVVNAIGLFGATSGLPTTGLGTTASPTVQQTPGNAIPERVANQITYTTPNVAGFSGSVGYTFGEVAGDNGANRSWGAQLGYVNGPLNVQFGYNDQDLSPSQTVELSKTKIGFLGATYDFGVVKLHAAYGQKKYDLENPTFEDFKVKAALVGVTVPFGASKIRAEYIHNNDDRSATDRDNNVMALSYTYSLSKRTTLYATYARIDNDTNSNVGFSGGTTTITANENTSVLALGVQHNF
jgi:predicted porin